MRLRAIRRWLLCLVFLFVALSAWGAINPLSPLGAKKAETETQPAPATTITDKDIDESRAKLESRLTELHLQLLPGAIAALHRTYHDTATPEELQEWETLTNRLARILDSHINTLIRLRNIRKANLDRVAEIKGWQGFAEKAPYPISLLDSLGDAIHARQIDLQSLEVMRTTAEGESQDFTSGLKNSRKAVLLAEENVDKNAGKPGEARSKWLLLLVQLRDSVNQSGAVYGEARRLMITESQEGTQAEIDFLRQKLAVARGNYRFTKEELERKLKEIDGRQGQMRQELDREVREEEKARKSLDASEAAVREAQAELASRPESKVALERLMKEREARQVTFDAADFRVQILRGILYLLKNEEAVWKDRYRLAEGPVAEAERTEPGIKRDDLALLAKWKEYVVSQFARLQILIKSQQEKLSSASIPDSDRQRASRMLSAYEEQETILRRGEAIINEYEQLVQRRNEESTGKQEPVTLAGRVRGALDTISSLARKVWYAELYVVEETIIAEGKRIVRPRSVTLGKLVVAILILLAGTWVIRRIKKIFHWFAMNRLKFSANEALLYSRLLSYVMFIVVVASALIFVNIPLTFFAFLGGALAIGIGFGAQNLINNFISGLILMFDRTIRMGDMVEVDGHRGRVATIGMRRMLVPNSLFLQQNVINWTSSDRRVRYSISIGVAYGSPTKETEQVILKAVIEQREVLSDPPAYVVFENFADSALIFTAYFWIELDPAVNTLMVFSDIRHRIGERLAAAGIAIPFPQRDLHLDTANPIEIKMVPPG
jgi:small-conductance mechanosensitive channel